MLGTAGTCPQFLWRGKSYTVGFPDDAAKARLEELIIRAETAAVLALKPLIPAEEYSRKLDRLARQNRSREYRTRSGSLWIEYMVGENRAQGFVLYVLSLLQAHHPELTDADVIIMLEECREFLTMAVDRVVPDFFGWLAAELGLSPDTILKATEDAQTILRHYVARISTTD